MILVLAVILALCHSTLDVFVWVTTTTHVDVLPDNRNGLCTTEAFYFSVPPPLYKSIMCSVDFYIHKFSVWIILTLTLMRQRSYRHVPYRCFSQLQYPLFLLINPPYSQTALPLFSLSILSLTHCTPTLLYRHSS